MSKSVKCVTQVHITHKNMWFCDSIEYASPVSPSLEMVDQNNYGTVLKYLFWIIVSWYYLVGWKQSEHCRVFYFGSKGVSRVPDRDIFPCFSCRYQGLNQVTVWALSLLLRHCFSLLPVDAHTSSSHIPPVFFHRRYSSTSSKPTRGRFGVLQYVALRCPFKRQLGLGLGHPLWHH